jgi:hypothetical protein
MQSATPYRSIYADNLALLALDVKVDLLIGKLEASVKMDQSPAVP